MENLISFYLIKQQVSGQSSRNIRNALNFIYYKTLAGTILSISPVYSLQEKQHTPALPSRWHAGLYKLAQTELDITAWARICRDKEGYL